MYTYEEMFEESQQPEAVKVTAAPSRKQKYPGLEPWQSALLYGGAASTVMGPLGLLIGLGSGIVAAKNKKTYLDREAAYHERLRAGELNARDELQRELEIADPDEARLLGHAQRMMDKGYRMLEAGNDDGARFVEKANAMMEGIMNADSAHRKAEQAAQASTQRGIITTAANAYREQYLKHMESFSNTDEQSSRILDMVADPNFDPNKPFNKAILMDLITVGVNGMYKDAPDMLDAIAEGAPSIGGILGARGGPGGAAIGQELGGLIGAATTAMKSEDFKLTREDYNRVALNMRRISEQVTNQRMQMTGQQARSLDNFARQVGAIPEDYSLGDYVSGGVKELRFNPAPKAPTPGARVAPTVPEAPSLPTRALNYLKNVHGSGTWKARPTN